MEVLALTNEIYSIDEEREYDSADSVEEDAMVAALSKRLEALLRQAKDALLTGGEVLLPNGLTYKISQDIFGMADKEPCGLRGCILYIYFEGEGFKKKLCTFRCDPSTPSTFEVYLTLKQSTTGWSNMLPQFLKKITRSGAVMISPEYQLLLKKLYRSSLN